VAEPRVSVIIPHYQDLQGLELCLSRLEAQTFPASDLEIVVADNASPCGLPAVKAVVAGRARVVVCTEKGAGPNRNAAVAASRGKILAFIDSDCQAEPGWLAAGVDGLDRFGLVGGRVTVLVADPARMTGAEAFEAVFAFDFKTYIERLGFTGAGNMFCTRETFDRVGPFMNGVSEDKEWSQRAVEKGVSLGYVEAAVVGHPARRNWGELVAKWRRLNQESYLLHRKRGGALVTWILRCLAMPVSAIAHTPKVLAARSLKGGRARFKAVTTLYRIRLWRLADGLRIAVRGA
jgi:glycosyltransferase involved in cell wall biosynthesis